MKESRFNSYSEAVPARGRRGECASCDDGSGGPVTGTLALRRRQAHSTRLFFSSYHSLPSSLHYSICLGLLALFSFLSSSMPQWSNAPWGWDPPDGGGCREKASWASSAKRMEMTKEEVARYGLHTSPVVPPLLIPSRTSVSEAARLYALLTSCRCTPHNIMRRHSKGFLLHTTSSPAHTVKTFIVKHQVDMGFKMDLLSYMPRRHGPFNRNHLWANSLRSSDGAKSYVCSECALQWASKLLLVRQSFFSSVVLGVCGEFRGLEGSLQYGVEAGMCRRLDTSPAFAHTSSHNNGLMMELRERMD